MKKFLYSVLPIIFAYMLTAVGYAEGKIMVGRVEIVDYVMFIGLGVFLVGMIMVLLAVFGGSKAKEEVLPDDYEEYDDYDEADEEYEEESYEEEPAEEIIEEPEEEIEEAEEVEEETPELEEEPVVEEEPEEVIRLTLSGVNNSDVRVMEFAESVTIGRKAGNDVIIEDKAVSGKHCEITYENGAVFITDLDSTNGTFINDEPVVRCEIETGDTIIIGKNKYKINISM